VDNQLHEEIVAITANLCGSEEGWFRLQAGSLDQWIGLIACPRHYGGQKQVRRGEFSKGDQYTFIALASSAKAIIAYHTGKRDTDNCDRFISDLRERVLGMPEISTDGYTPYLTAIRDAFGNRVAHGVVTKTYSVTHLTVTEASRRYSPAAVVAVSRDVVSGVPAEISTSYVERQNLTVRMSSRRFTRLTNAFSKKLENHAAAVSLYVTHYNMCRVHEALRTTPAVTAFSC
jgi:IS1 family transposase